MTTPNSPRAMIDTIAYIKRDPHLFRDGIKKHLEEVYLVSRMLKIAANIRSLLREYTRLDPGERLDNKIYRDLAHAKEAPFKVPISIIYSRQIVLVLTQCLSVQAARPLVFKTMTVGTENNHILKLMFSHHCPVFNMIDLKRRHGSTGGDCASMARLNHQAALKRCRNWRPSFCHLPMSACLALSQIHSEIKSVHDCPYCPLTCYRTVESSRSAHGFSESP
jgi:hypothetical protein